MFLKVVVVVVVVVVLVPKPLLRARSPLQAGVGGYVILMATTLLVESDSALPLVMPYAM